MRPFFLVLCLDGIYGIDMDKEKKKLELIEQVSGIADELALGYVEKLRKSIIAADDGQKSINPHEMDRVLRISKQYSERLLLAEGKNTSNIGVDGKGGLPFKFVINKHYPSAPVADKDEEDDTAEGDSIDE